MSLTTGFAEAKRTSRSDSETRDGKVELTGEML